MGQFTELVAYLLACVGATVLVVWPEGGPGAFVRERMLRGVLPKPAQDVLDCYICFGFWMGLILSVPWWFMFHRGYIWFGCLMIPGLFWLITGKWKQG